eukprot:1238917-Pyramimonas_sp.AAC.1
MPAPARPSGGAAGSDLFGSGFKGPRRWRRRSPRRVMGGQEVNTMHMREQGLCTQSDRAS